MIALFLV